MIYCMSNFILFVLMIYKTIKCGDLYEYKLNPYVLNAQTDFLPILKQNFQYFYKPNISFDKPIKYRLNIEDFKDFYIDCIIDDIILDNSSNFQDLIEEFSKIQNYYEYFPESRLFGFSGNIEELKNKKFNLMRNSLQDYRSDAVSTARELRYNRIHDSIEDEPQSVILDRLLKGFGAERNT